MLTKLIFNQVGGAKPKKGQMLPFVLMVIVLFVVKSWIVQFAYNMVVPRLVLNNGNNLSNFRPLSLTEAMGLTLLVSTLVN